MMQKNKIIALTVIGLVLGAIVGAVSNVEQANLIVLAVVGGVIGFLAGWIWKSRSPDSTE